MTKQLTYIPQYQDYTYPHNEKSRQNPIYKAQMEKEAKEKGVVILKKGIKP